MTGWRDRSVPSWSPGSRSASEKADPSPHPAGYRRATAAFTGKGHPMPHLLRRSLIALLALGGAGLSASHPVHAATTMTVSNCNSASQLEIDVITANSDNAGDIIKFSCSGLIFQSVPLGITGNMTIDGSGQTVALEGQHATKLMTVESGVTLTINDLTFQGGVAPEGGAMSSAGTVTITNSTFLSNDANIADGGALYNSGTMTIANSTFSGNTAPVGGALANSGTMTITNSTLAGNTASGSGGAIENDNNLTIGATIVVGSAGHNCVFDSNSSVLDNGYNLEDGTDCGFTGTGDLQNANAQLGALASNGGPTQTMALGATSQAIDAVPVFTGLCPSTDQRGYTRPDGSGETSCDIGAYESGAAPTIARVASFSVRRVRTGAGSRLASHWRMVQVGGVVGFNLYAGSHRLNGHIIRVHAAASYRYSVHWSGHGPYRLETLLATGGSLHVSAP